MKTLWKESKLLCILSIISVVVVISYNISYDWPELIEGIGRWYTLCYDLSIGVLINFIFYIFQVFLVARDREKKALKIIKPKVEWLYWAMSDIVLVVENYIKIYDDETISIPLETAYFVRKNKENKEGWIVKVELTKEGLEIYRSNINDSIDKIINNPMYSNNNIELVEKIAILQANRLLNHLIDYLKNPIEKRENLRFGKIRESFDEFRNITIYLGTVVTKSYMEFTKASSEQIRCYDINCEELMSEDKRRLPRVATMVE